VAGLAVDCDHGGDRGGVRVVAVVSRIQTRAGNVGYRHQLDRARRFLDRVQRGYEGLEDLDDVEFQDMMWSFFQHCWHVKDWMRHDPLASDAQKEAVIKLAHQSGALMICRDLCNGTKHLNLSHPSSGAGASHQYVDMDIDTGMGRYELDCIIDDGHGKQMSGKQLARECIAEWERILQSQGLATTRSS
jgi:hypothetical protein